MNEIVKCMNEMIFCFDYTNMQDYDKLHYTNINASESQLVKRDNTPRGSVNRRKDSLPKYKQC
jgi:hypothetical protein